MTEVPKYPSEVIQHIEAMQKQRLSITFGPNFEKDLQNIFPNPAFSFRLSLFHLKSLILMTKKYI